MTLSPISTLLLGIIVGCVVTTLIHTLTVSCVQCGSSSSRSLVGLDRFSSIYTSNDRFRAQQLGMMSSDSSCASLRLQLETLKAPPASNTISKKRKRSIDDSKGITTTNTVAMLNIYTSYFSAVNIFSCLLL